jgi:hypothetical protein
VVCVCLFACCVTAGGLCVVISLLCDRWCLSVFVLIVCFLIASVFCVCVLFVFCVTDFRLCVCVFCNSYGFVCVCVFL